MIVPLAEFEKSLRRVAQFADDRSSAVKLALSANTLKISSKADDKGESEDTIETPYTKEAIAIGFNANYLLDFLKADEEWAFVLPYLLLCREDSPQRKHDLRAVFNALRYVAKTGGQWRFLPNDMPPWHVVYQQMQRWLKWGCFEMLVEDVRSLLREWGGRKGQPTAVCIDSRTLQSTPESGSRAGYDGAKRRKGSKVHIAVDTLGHLLALTVTPADHGDREQVAALAEEVQQVTGNNVELAYVDQGYTGPSAAEAAQQHGLKLEVVKHPMAKRGFVLLPRRWVVERSFAWASRFRRLARDYERLDTTLKGLHLLAFAILMLRNLAETTA